MPSMSISLTISFCALSIFFISFVASTRTPLDPRRVAAREELNNHRNESRRILGHSENNDYNDIDNCWMSTDWESNRQQLADCAVGFGKDTVGGKGGKFYEVTTTEDDPTNPTFGMLRHAVTLTEPLWIIFKYEKMVFNFQQELIMTSHKTLDGRGSKVKIFGPACLVVQNAEHVIIHGLEISNCEPTGGDGTIVISSETHKGHRGRTEGDAVSLWAATNVWLDHCKLSKSTDGLFDAVESSSLITVSNTIFSHHNEVMLLGHNDGYSEDKDLKVTLIYNHFGPGLIQRMPRARFGVVHVINNLYEPWGMYAIGGSAKVTILSKGNRFIASDDSELKEVTKHLDGLPCNWITDGDAMINGAYFKSSGSDDPDSQVYQTNSDSATSSVRDASNIYSLVANAGPLNL